MVIVLDHFSTLIVKARGKDTKKSFTSKKNGLFFSPSVLDLSSELIEKYLALLALLAPDWL